MPLIGIISKKFAILCNSLCHSNDISSYTIGDSIKEVYCNEVVKLRGNIMVHALFIIRSLFFICDVAVKCFSDFKLVILIQHFVLNSVPC